MELLKLTTAIFFGINILWGALITIECYAQDIKNKNFTWATFLIFPIIWFFASIPIFNIHIFLEDELFKKDNLVFLTKENVYNFIYFLPVIALMGLWLI